MRYFLKAWEFDLVFRTDPRLKKNIRGELVRLLLLKNNFNLKNHVGYAVGKKMGKAHIRVRGRRILREAFNEVKDLLKPDLIIILSLSSKGLNAKSHEILRELKFLLKKNNLLINNACLACNKIN